VDDVVAGGGERVSQPTREVLVEKESHEVGVRGSARSRTASAA
jgi:hypothetical protein